VTPRGLDEDDVRTRPGRGSRPRSRLRPDHDDAVAATVVAVDRGRFDCLVDGRLVLATRAGELRRTPVVVGDRVSLAGDTGGAEGSLARIVRVADRTTVLRRSADDTDPVERPLVANADQLLVVVALADPEPQPRLVDRCLVAAFDGGLAPVLCLTKSDLAPAEPLLQRYAALDVDAVVLAVKSGAGLDEVRARLAGRTSVLVGSSGVGKSTLVNALVPDAARATAAVGVAGKGRHTSSSAVALALPGGGWVVDTPGVRSFGLGHVTPASLLRGFPDLLPGVDDCPRGCSHTTAEADECGLDARVRAGAAAADRLDSYRRLLAQTTPNL
jgi:ribosome biogenesis GTPase / thiamine phosphate phosphatase